MGIGTIFMSHYVTGRKPAGRSRNNLTTCFEYLANSLTMHTPKLEFHKLANKDGLSGTPGLIKILGVFIREAHVP